MNKGISSPRQLRILNFFAALMSMSSNKAPGLNGFPVEFFNKFWINFADLFKDLVTESFGAGALSLEQRRTVIRLIPKPVPDTDRYKFTKYRRPIALLNIDYKIISKTLTLRLLRVIDSLITAEQLAYPKGRFICEHIRTLSDLIDVYSGSGHAGYVVFHNFEKAFDSIEWNFLYATLEAMRFPPYFITWAKILNTQMTGAIIVNSKLTDFFTFSRGCRQGDPLSAYLFILAMQAFVSSYASDFAPTSLKLADQFIPILLYADDTVTLHSSIISGRLATLS